VFIRASMLSSGALAIHPSWFPGPGQYAFPSSGGSRNGGPGGLAGWARCWVLRKRPPGGGWFLRCGPGSRFPWLGGRVLVAVRFLRTAQWTRASPVSAIWNSVSACFVPSFLGHTVDALAPGADEGRWSLRYAPGSRQPGCDPGVSEWGNLAPVMGGRRRLNA
jgi:hypothetical protein